MIPVHPVVRRLAQERFTRGLSQRDAANLAGLSRSTITAWESGDAQPTLNVLEILLAAYDLELAVVPRRETDRERQARMDAMTVPELLTELIGELAGLLLDEDPQVDEPMFHDVSRERSPSVGACDAEPVQTQPHDAGRDVNRSAPASSRPDRTGEAVKAA